MNQTHATAKRSKKIQAVEEEAGIALRERVDHVRDIVEDVRAKAEVAFRDKPYLVPVAAGAVGLGIGVLLGSKLTRFLLFTAVGTMVSDVLGGEIKRVASDFMSEFRKRLDENDPDEGVGNA